MVFVDNRSDGGVDSSPSDCHYYFHLHAAAPSDRDIRSSDIRSNAHVSKDDVISDMMYHLEPPLLEFISNCAMEADVIKTIIFTEFC